MTWKIKHIRLSVDTTIDMNEHDFTMSHKQPRENFFQTWKKAILALAEKWKTIYRRIPSSRHNCCILQRHVGNTSWLDILCKPTDRFRRMSPPCKVYIPTYKPHLWKEIKIDLNKLPSFLPKLQKLKKNVLILSWAQFFSNNWSVVKHLAIVFST